MLRTSLIPSSVLSCAKAALLHVARQPWCSKRSQLATLRDVLQVALMSGLLSDREEHAKDLRLAMQGARLKRKDGEAALAVELLARQPRPLTRNILLAAQPQASVASGLAPDSEAAGGRSSEGSSGVSAGYARALSHASGAAPGS